MNKNYKIHHPPHLYFDDYIYFITSRTIKKKKLFNSDDKKNLIKSSLIKASEKYKFKIFGWVILENHYHLLLKIIKSSDLSKFIRYINSRSAVLLRKLQRTWCQDSQTECQNFCSNPVGADAPTLRNLNNTQPEHPGFCPDQQPECQGLRPDRSGQSPNTPAKNKQEIWFNYHDRFIRDEVDFFKHLNYIHNQPIKHGCVKNYNHLNEYQFSSLQHYLKTKGQKWLDQCFEDYPIIDFSTDE